eukprot:scaffold15027_cov25-Tisochrysis_lutea.AAC.1
MIITAGQIIWTHECEKALADADSARRAVKALKKKWISYLNKLTIITRSKLNKIERGKVRPLLVVAALPGLSNPCIHSWPLSNDVPVGVLLVHAVHVHA